ncbi:MAG: hypothetical protein QG608_162 [Actinomycetota bacterium]|nr:hypothetical protein [Actinomycetota bacterium]
MHETRVAAVLLLAGTALLCGCGSAGSGPPPVMLPEVGRTPVARLSQEQAAVAQSVGEYHQLLQRAAGGETVDGAQLSSVATSEWAGQVGRLLRRSAAQRHTVRGQARHTPRTITVVGDSATYVECLDPQGAQALESGTVHTGGSVRPDTAVPGTRAQWRTVSVVRRDGAWKVAQVEDGARC